MDPQSALLPSSLLCPTDPEAQVSCCFPRSHSQMGQLRRTKLSCPQLKDDGGQDEEEGVPAQGDCEASPHHELRQTPTCRKTPDY